MLVWHGCCMCTPTGSLVAPHLMELVEPNDCSVTANVSVLWPCACVLTGGFHMHDFEHLSLGFLPEPEAKSFMYGDSGQGWPGLLNISHPTAVAAGFSCPEDQWPVLHSLCGGNMAAMRMVCSWAAASFMCSVEAAGADAAAGAGKEAFVAQSWEAGGFLGGVLSSVCVSTACVMYRNRGMVTRLRLGTSLHKC